jgi:tail tube protein
MPQPNRRIAGVAYLAVDGQVFPLKADLTISTDTMKREAIMGQDGFHGYSEVPVVSTVKCKISDRGDIGLTRLAAIVNATLTMELASGKVFIARNCFTMEGPRELNTQTGEVELTFGSPEITELLAP